MPSLNFNIPNVKVPPWLSLLLWALWWSLVLLHPTFNSELGLFRTWFGTLERRYQSNTWNVPRVRNRHFYFIFLRLPWAFHLKGEIWQFTHTVLLYMMPQNNADLVHLGPLTLLANLTVHTRCTTFPCPSFNRKHAALTLMHLSLDPQFILRLFHTVHVY